MFDSGDDFTETGVFGKRGITRDVAEGAFYRYELIDLEDDNGESVKAFIETWDEANPTIWSYLAALSMYANDHPDEPEVWDEMWSLFTRLTSAASRDMTLATRSRGVLMRRFDVPEARDPFILAEMRPDHAIATNLTNWGLNRSVTKHRHGPKLEYEHEGMSEDERRHATRAAMDDYSLIGGDGHSGHLYRDKVDAEAVRAGVTEVEFHGLEQLEGWDVMRGGDHAGIDPGADVDHVHVGVAKYVFPATPVFDQIEIGTPHAHTDFDDEERYGENRDVMEFTHRYYAHGSQSNTADYTLTGLLDPYDGWLRNITSSGTSYTRTRGHSEIPTSHQPCDSARTRLASSGSQPRIGCCSCWKAASRKGRRLPSARQRSAAQASRFGTRPSSRGSPTSTYAASRSWWCATRTGGLPGPRRPHKRQR